MIVFEILRFCRITFQFSIFSHVLLRFFLLHVLGWLVRKTLVKHMRIPKIEKLYDKISKSQILSFTIWNTPLTLHAHQISARSDQYTWCTGERNCKPTIFLTYHGAVYPGKCIKSYILFLYRHVHLYNASFDLKIGVLVLLASVRKW